MSSTAISGKPGGGKSLYAVSLLLDELLNSERVIVTNIPLRLDNIIKYLASKGREDISVYERILLIGTDNVRLGNATVGDEAVKEFWRYRGTRPEDILPAFTDEEIKAGKRPAMTDFGTRGVVYFLDELHEHLNSRQWQKTGEMLLWYIAKHRHFGDDVFWITQSVPNVDRQWRSVTQEYRYIRNFSKESWNGFSKGDYFQMESYLEPYTGSQTAQDSKKFRLDRRGIQDCYYTSLAAGAADKGQKSKGIPIWVLYGGIIGGAALVCGVFILVPRWASDKMSAKAVNTLDGISKGSQISAKPTTGTNSVAAGGAPLDTPDLSKEDKPLQVVAVPLREAVATQVVEALKGSQQVVNDVGVIPNAANDGLILTGTDFHRLVAFAEVVRQYDRQARLITINAVVGRLVKGKGLKAGLYDMLRSGNSSLSALLSSATYDVATGLFTFGSAVAASQALQAITDFRSDGYRFEVVSRPSLTVVAGQSGTFATGREIPLPVTTRDATGSSSSVDYRRAEFLFQVSPTLKTDSWIRLFIEQENTDVLSSAEIDGNAVPTLSTQKVKTVIDLHPDQVAYLGGIRVRTQNRDKYGVPILKDIPGLDLIFARREHASEESELVLLVSVEVHRDGVGSIPVRKALPAHQRTFDQRWLDDVSTLSPEPRAERSTPTVNREAKTKRKDKSK